MNNNLDDANKAQSEEMEKHRWVESKKAGHDVGKPAYMDWILKYAKAWRENWNLDHPS